MRYSKSALWYRSIRTKILLKYLYIILIHIKDDKLDITILSSAFLFTVSWIADRGQHDKMVYISFYRNPSSTSKTKVMAKGCKWMLVLVLLLVKKISMEMASREMRILQFEIQINLMLLPFEKFSAFSLFWKSPKSRSIKRSL